MLRYAKRGKGSKSKRKGAKNTGHPVPQWRRANPAFITKDWRDNGGPRGEFVSKPREYANGSEQHLGHVCLTGCKCLSRKDWPDNYSEEYKAKVRADKALAKRIKEHEMRGAVCGVHFTLIPRSGKCTLCESEA